MAAWAIRDKGPSGVHELTAGFTKQRSYGWASPASATLSLQIRRYEEQKPDRQTRCGENQKRPEPAMRVRDVFAGELIALLLSARGVSGSGVGRPRRLGWRHRRLNTDDQAGSFGER